MLNRLLIFIIDVCLLRRGPEDAPAQVFAAVVAILLNFTLLLWVFKDNPQAIPILPALQITLVTLLAVRVVLSIQNHLARYWQSIFTLFATGSIVTLVFEASLLLLGNDPNNTSTTPLIILPLLIWVWSFVIDAHIYRRALGSSFAIGMLLTVLLYATNNLLLDLWYFPVIEDTVQ